MKVLLFFEIKAYWPQWVRIMLIVLCACMLLGSMGFAWWKIYETRMEAYLDFNRTYEGIRWTYWDLEPSVGFTVTVEGKKNGYGEFAGTIVIRGDGFEHRFEDCRVKVESTGTVFLCSSEVDVRNDPAAFGDCAYGWMMLDPDWNTIVFYKLSEGWAIVDKSSIPNYVYTAPATDLEEAVRLTKDLAQKFEAFWDMTWDKRDYK